MDIAGFIKDYQSLIGSFLGVVAPLFLWFLFKYIEDKKIESDSKKEILNIFTMSLRECEDSIVNLTSYVQDLEKNVKLDNESFDIILPSKFNKIPVNENALVNLSRNLHPLICEQINIANSAAKKFNSWLVHYEEMPVFMFDSNMKILQAGIETKEKVVSDYYEDLSIYTKGIIAHLNKNAEIVRQHLLRPVVVMQYKEKDLERLFLTKKLDDQLNEDARMFLSSNRRFTDNETAAV